MEIKPLTMHMQFTTRW